MQTAELEQETFFVYGEVVDFPATKPSADSEDEPLQFTLKLGSYTRRVEAIKGVTFVSLTGTHWSGTVCSLAQDDEPGGETAQVHVLNTFQGEKLFILS